MSDNIFAGPNFVPELHRCRPGTILAVRTGGRPAWWIRFGAGLRGLPNLDNHIVGVDHVDASGTVWGIEGRPGGVGWVDCAKYFQGNYGKYVVSNWKQQIPFPERSRITERMRSLLGTKYDWEAIAADGMQDLHLPAIWEDHVTWGPQAPAHVVCSSAMAWAYEAEGMNGPYTQPAEGVRAKVLKSLPLIQPGDWTRWILENGYN